MDSLFGGTERETQPSGGSAIEGLNQLRLALATQTASGDITQSMRGYIDKVLIPSTMNTAIAMGLGRAGAATDMISNAVLSQGTGFLQALLSGVPAGAQGGTTTERRVPGIADWVGLIQPIGQGIDWISKIFGGSEK